MKLYADTPARRTRQITGDVVALGWVVLWVWLALELRERILKLAAPGWALERAGTSFTGGLNEAGDKVGGLPVVGDDVAGALRRAGGAGTSVAEAGRSQQDAVAQLGWVLPLLVFLLAAGIVLVRWLPGRLAWAREATAANRLLAGPDATEVFATRAVVNRPTTTLATLPEGTITAWRSGDPAAAATLAALELKTLGLQAP